MEQLLNQLEPSQVERLFELKEIFNEQEIDILVNALEASNWNTESAFQILLTSTSQHHHNEMHEDQRAVMQPTNSKSTIFHNKQEIQKQNEEYFRMADNLAIKQIQENQKRHSQREIEKQLARDKAFFTNHHIQYAIHIKFRLPLKVITKAFDFRDTIETLYKYVNSHLRDAFENRYSRFDLLQIPSTSLGRIMEERLSCAFGVDSAGVVLIVKEID